MYETFMQFHDMLGLLSLVIMGVLIYLGLHE